MRTHILACTIAIMLAAPCLAERTLHELVGLTLRAHKDLDALNARQLEASTESRLTTKYLTTLKKALEGDVVDHVAVSRLNRTIMRKEKALNRLQSKTQDKQAIAAAQYELTLLRRCALETAEQDSDKRKELLAKATRELAQVKAKHDKQRAAFEMEYARFVDLYKPHKRDLERAMYSLIRPGKGKYESDRRIKARASEGGVETTWTNDKDKSVAHLLVRFREPKPLPMNQQIEYLDGKYPITRSSDTSITVLAGYAHLVFRGDHKSLRSADVLKMQIRKFVDLKGLATIKPVIPDRLPEPDAPDKTRRPKD